MGAGLRLARLPQSELVSVRILFACSSSGLLPQSVHLASSLLRRVPWAPPDSRSLALLLLCPRYAARAGSAAEQRRPLVCRRPDDAIEPRFGFVTARGFVNWVFRSIMARSARGLAVILPIVRYFYNFARPGQHPWLAPQFPSTGLAATGDHLGRPSTLVSKCRDKVIASIAFAMLAAWIGLPSRKYTITLATSSRRRSDAGETTHIGFLKSGIRSPAG